MSHPLVQNTKIRMFSIWMLNASVLFPVPKFLGSKYIFLSSSSSGWREKRKNLHAYNFLQLEFKNQLKTQQFVFKKKVGVQDWVGLDAWELKSCAPKITSNSIVIYKIHGRESLFETNTRELRNLNTFNWICSPSTMGLPIFNCSQLKFVAIISTVALFLFDFLSDPFDFSSLKTGWTGSARRALSFIRGP